MSKVAAEWIAELQLEVKNLKERIHQLEAESVAEREAYDAAEKRITALTDGLRKIDNCGVVDGCDSCKITLTELIGGT